MMRYRSTLPPILPAGTIHTSFRLHFHSAHTPGKASLKYMETYLFTNSLSTILTLDLLLNHRVIRRPPIHPRNNEKCQSNDE